MSRLNQRGRSAGAKPLRLRLAVLLCVLLVGGAGIAQAAHIHGDWLPHNAPQAGASSTQPGGISEDSCPLCTAMHSALPGSGFVALVAALLVTVSVVCFAGRKPETPWHFAAFSRPPPHLVIL